MAERLLRLMRLAGGSRRGPVLVNLGTVAWMEGDAGGGTRVVFAGAAGTTDEEAIAQAWADQTALRQGDADEGPSI